MNYRIAESSDIAGILDLQEKNLVTNLTDEKKKNGFVTTPFTGEQIHDLIQLDGLFVIDGNSKILGYAVAAGWDYFHGRPMFEHMIKLFGRITYKGIKIDLKNSFQYGPVCIDFNLRGTDSFPMLFSKMKEEMGDKYEVGTTFINKVNTRSYFAHTRKAGIEVINEFEFNNNKYYGLAFLTKEKYSRAGQANDNPNGFQ
ncbi:GNAT family acetyltransferase [Thiobaca trueperi]|nr:GNAT family acetyltransferase [Thiobaca trueperi]